MQMTSWVKTVAGAKTVGTRVALVSCTLLGTAIPSTASAVEGECSFNGTKIADDCSLLGWQKEGDFYVGCCSTTTLVWCETDGTALCTIPCANSQATCGWVESGEFYDCTETADPDPSGTNPIACDVDCSPQCDGKTCGFDGCLGYCGSCSGETPDCVEGACTCTPKCDGKTCGDDGCGGTCGACGDGESCFADNCCKPQCDGKNCGDNGCGGTCGTCETGNFCASAGSCQLCSCDGRVCGDDGCGVACGTCTGGLGCDTAGQCVEVPGGCNPTETPGCSGCACETEVCTGDDFCCTTEWDFVCVSMCEGTELQQCPCVPQCDGLACGDDGCGGTCGTCGEGTQCAPDGSKCFACDCTGQECGDNGCGTSCGECGEGELCTTGQCVPAGCGAEPNGESGCKDCACQACVCAADDYCCNTVWDNICAGICATDCGGNCPECVPNCIGKECGDDGCGGSCGACATDGDVCSSFTDLCCKPQCDGKQCGNDGCGGTCGECTGGLICEDSQCVVCTPQCDGLLCGDDGCGGSCGECGAGTECSSGACQGPYPEACRGAGEPSAATCPEGLTSEGCCDAQGRVTWCADGQLYCADCNQNESPSCGWSEENRFYDCGSSGAETTGEFPLGCGFCVPSCSGKACGDDGCGGTCGKCGLDQTCSADGQCVGGGADGTPGEDATDGSDGATDATDGTPGADGTTDATDGATDATDGATDGATDSTDGATSADGAAAGDAGGSSGCSNATNRNSSFAATFLVGLMLMMGLLARRRAR